MVAINRLTEPVHWIAISILGSILAALVAASPLQASEPDLAEERASIERFQALDQRLQDIGWRLARGNADFCARTVPSVGLQLQDVASYGAPDTVRAALGLNGDFAIQSVAASSPASMSPELASNVEIAALGTTNPNIWEAGKRSYWQRLARAHEYIDANLAQTGAVQLGLTNGATVDLEAVPVCASRFELSGRGKRALADGSRVIIGLRFPGLAYPEDELAAAIAHELAHNLLAHRNWLDENGRKRRNIRLTEREADRLMPWLLANADYDPRAAHRFMERWGPKHSGGLLRARTHDGWDERAEFILAEIPQIEALMADTGRADWATHFRRETEPVN